MNKDVICHLCPRHCLLSEGMRGNCRVRMNINGRLQSLVYGNPCSVHVDPIEKKPLFHFLPTSSSFSIATAGCNLHCKYCQNWQISQESPENLESYDMPPEKVVSEAINARCKSISYTYSEPIVFYEYTYDTSKIAKEKGIKNVMVTAGYIEQEPLIDLCQYIDAANVDIKGITEEFYQNMSYGTLRPVLETVKTMIKKGLWVEITNLIVPSWNDKENDIRELCKWMFSNVGPDVPIHFSRFWPMHKLKNLPPTPTETLDMAYKIGFEEGLNYVYVGNIPGHKGNNTFCPTDKRLLIGRQGYSILENNIIDGKCKFCSTKIPGVWS